MVYVLFDGFAATDVVGPADVFATANQIAGAACYRLHYVATQAEMKASNRLRFVAEPVADLSASTRSMLVVPGADEAPLSAALADQRLIAHVTRLAKGAARTCSVCSGAFLLAAAGLLDGRLATTHWRGLDALAARFPAVRVERTALYVEDGPLWTSAGVTAGIDMALAIVARDLGHAVAISVARELVLFLVRTGGQAQFSGALDHQAKAINTDLRALPPWLEANLTARVSVADMAAAMNMSERSLHRRCVVVFGMTPLALLQNLRLERARTLLEDHAIPLKQIVGLCGLGDTSTMGKLFRSRFGVTLSDYRAKFRASAAVPPPAINH